MQALQPLSLLPVVHVLLGQQEMMCSMTGAKNDDDNN
jgi:hypothetical protein